MNNRMVSNLSMEIFAIRRNNLRLLIDNEYSKNQADFARSVGIKTPQINRWLSITASEGRNITEKSARKIEGAAGKEPGWLDDVRHLCANEPAGNKYSPTIITKSKRQTRIDSINALLEATDDEGLVAILYEAGKIAGQFPLVKQTPASSR